MMLFFISHEFLYKIKELKFDLQISLEPLTPRILGPFNIPSALLRCPTYFIRVIYNLS
jgi:hypothetical protein